MSDTLLVLLGIGVPLYSALAGFQHAIDRCPADLEDLCDLRWRPCPCAFIARTWAADALELALAAEVCFEFGEYVQHVQEALAGRGARVDRLLGRLEGGAAGADQAASGGALLMPLCPSCCGVWWARRSRPAPNRRTCLSALQDGVEQKGGDQHSA